MPRNWDEIAPGHLVIANEGVGQGWWEAIVVEASGDMLTLHWRDYPWQKNVVQHRSAVALIKPGDGERQSPVGCEPVAEIGRHQRRRVFERRRVIGSPARQLAAKVGELLIVGVREVVCRVCCA